MTNLLELLKQSPSLPLWKQMGFSHRHGINIPLFALRSEKGTGIGEYLDLIPLIDWAAEIGLNVIQLLPLNDSGKDPSPYNALSSCALHPIYLSLYDLPFLWKYPSLIEDLTPFEAFKKPKKVPYSQVLAAKKAFIKKYFDHIFPLISKTEHYQEFLEKNRAWLMPFVLFKSLKQIFEQKDWMDWPEEYKFPSKTILRKLEEELSEDIQHHCLTQFLCQEQLKRVRDYATSRGVYLKGDIPILISPDSCDVWMHPQEFDMTYAAGAPPDVFNEEGQYWGFPLFKWDTMREDNYGWWKRRLEVACQFYDIYRIDHIIGFFRIWAIPRGESPRKGTYMPPTDDLVVMQGKSLIEMMMNSSKMFPIGEDLGVMPDSIYTALRELGICGTKVIRWEKDRATHRIFTPYNEYYPFSMTSVSTHDSETLQLWWKKYPEEARAFSHFKLWHYTPELSTERHKEILWDSHHTASLFHINLLQEYFALFPELAWPDQEDERINIPGYILPANWTYRFRPWLEEIISHEPLKKLLQELTS